MKTGEYQIRSPKHSFPFLRIQNVSFFCLVQVADDMRNQVRMRKYPCQAIRPSSAESVYEYSCFVLGIHGYIRWDPFLRYPGHVPVGGRFLSRQASAIELPQLGIKCNAKDISILFVMKRFVRSSIESDFVPPWFLMYDTTVRLLY